MQHEDRLSSREKALIGLASAVGAGCRTCAERLVPMAEAAGATPQDIETALACGLAGRASAAETMREKASSLLGREVRSHAGSLGDARIDELLRLAAVAAANSGPDAVGHLRAARSRGAPDGEVVATLAIARKVRAKAQGFADEEIEKARGVSLKHRPHDTGVLCCSDGAGA